MSELRKFRPTNADQGLSFEAGYCLNCRKYRVSKQDDYYCRILLYTLVFNVDDPEYPSHWIYQEDGSPTCTAFDDKRLKRVRKLKVDKSPDQLFQ
jgi:hypothetical protein